MKVCDVCLRKGEKDCLEPDTGLTRCINFRGDLDLITPLLRDGERLEWLMEQSVMEGNHKHHPSGNAEYVLRHTRRNGLPVIFQEDTPREAIDAAMAAEEAPNEPG